MFLIAEVGQAHQGSMEKALEYISALSQTGVDAVKFQVHIADAESSIHEPFRVKMATTDKTRFDYWKRMEFTKDEWMLIKSRCDEKGVEFMASPFSNAAVDLLEEIGVKRYKIGSGEVNNFLLLKKIAGTGKPVIISSGMSSLEELNKTVNFLRDQNVVFSLLQCTTSYPTQPQNYGLNVIQELKLRYDIPVGYSDHSARIETCIAAMVLGAEILEFHAIMDREQSPTPDANSSLEMEEIIELVTSVRNLEKALKNPVDKTSSKAFNDLKNIFEKSLAVNKDLEKGHILSFEDLEAKKPKGFGIEAAKFESVIGKKVKRDLNQWEFLTETDFQ